MTIENHFGTSLLSKRSVTRLSLASEYGENVSFQTKTIFLSIIVVQGNFYKVDHSLSQSGQAIYSLRPFTLVQWQCASQQLDSLLITKKEGSYEIVEHPTLLFLAISERSSRTSHAELRDLSYIIE